MIEATLASRVVAQGQENRLDFKFKTPAGVLYDPADITVQIQREADGDLDTHVYDADSSSSASFSSEIIKSATGIYYLDIETDLQSGIYFWRISSTGPSGRQEAKGDSFYVEPSNIDESSSSS